MKLQLEELDESEKLIQKHWPVSQEPHGLELKIRNFSCTFSPGCLTFMKSAYLFCYHISVLFAQG